MALDFFLSLSLQQRATRLVGPATHGAMARRAMAAPCVLAMVAAVATLATMAWLVPAQAQQQGASPAAVAAGYPSRPLRLVVPHAAGGNSDAFGRILGARLAERLGQQVIVENRAGAGGTVASESIARATPDGYLFMVGDNGTHAVAPTLFARLNYNVMRDFTPITLAASFPTVLLLHPSVPAKNTQEFIALVRANPGKYSFASAGTGNVSHLAQEIFRTVAGGLDMTHIPYKGGAPAVQALLAGDVTMTAVSANTALPHIRSGRARPFGVASDKRAAALPDVPTLAEAGLKGAEAGAWLAIFAPPGLPRDIVSVLNREIVATLNLPDVRERLSAIGLEVIGSSAEQLTAYLPGELEKWGRAVRLSGARVD